MLLISGPSHLRLRTVALLATVILLGGCRAAGSLTAMPTPATTASAAAPSPSPTPSAAGTGGCGGGDVSVDYAPYTTSTLAGYGWGFVVGQVAGFGAAVFNTTDGLALPGWDAYTRNGPNLPDVRIYTPVSVRVDQVLSGRTAPGINRLFIEGGTIGCYVVRVDVSPRLTEGARYVFIVTDARNTDGKSLLDYQEAKFAWFITADGMVMTPDGAQTVEWIRQVIAQTTPAPRSSTGP